ncbi:MAG: glycosyltransferase family 4 protein [Paludibacteraceae bacterium]|nr:glycosyltransferase family 4 protein [Paludibacteraceae bacterium]
MKKHILLVGNTAWSMYNFRGNLMRNLVSNGYKISVLSPFDKEYFPLIESTGAQCYDLPISAKGTNPIEDLSLVWKIRSYIKQLKPDFAFFYTIKPNIYGGFAARLCKIPFIPVTTGLGYTFIVDNWVSKLARKLYKFSFKGADNVWFLNEDDKKDFLKYKILPEEKTFVLNGEGVDTGRFAIAELPKGNSFLLMARMLWDKGVGEYVEAARVLKKGYPDAEFNLLGFLNAENPAAISEDQIKAWEKEGVVKYLGVTKDVRPFLKKTTALVLPSYREGIPVSLLEAASMARVIVTTDAVGCRNAVDDAVNGFLVPIKDAASLAEAMRKVIVMSDEEKMEMGLAGRKKVENEFAEEKVFEVYKSVLEKSL